MTKRLLILLILLLAACGGTAATTAASDDTDDNTTTSAAEVEEEGDGETVNLSDMPQECIDAFVEFLQAIEPVVDGFDFETSTVDEMTAIGTELEAATAGPTADMENLNCPDVDGTDEQTFAAMMDIAENEAPGTVGYFRWIEELSAVDGGGVTASGDCETDIEALEAIIADKETMGSLTMGEMTEVGVLMSAVSTECSADRSTEFFAQPEVVAFTTSSG